MTEKEVLNNILKIQKPGIFNDSNQYEVSLDDSKEWGKIFSFLEKSDLLEEIEEQSDLENFAYSYVDENSEDEFTISLLSSLDEDTYSITIEKM